MLPLFLLENNMIFIQYPNNIPRNTQIWKRGGFGFGTTKYNYVNIKYRIVNTHTMVGYDDSGALDWNIMKYELFAITKIILP
jgi:hypothetical protein